MTGSIGAGPIYPITGLGGFGDFNYYAPTDNLLIPTSATTATVDAGGVAFYIQGNGEATFINIGPLTGLIVGGSGEPVSLSITEISESVPEPGVTALAVAGGLGLLGFRRKQ
jgi:hypothetical protein